MVSKTPSHTTAVIIGFALFLILMSFLAVSQPTVTASAKATAAPTPSPSPTPDIPQRCVNHNQQACIQVRVAPMAPQIVSDTFGKRIARNFVAIQVTIANHDREYQYLLNDVSLTIPKEIFVPQPFLPRLDTASEDQSGYFFSSAELSLLRGVAEKGQGQDTRNRLLRLFRGIGTIAGGLVGVAGFGPSYADAVAVFNGPVISAFSEAFPDYTINQMNRLNDSAYTANTLIPAKHSKVMVAFIPQAVFLNKSQRKLFWSDPTSLYPDSSGACRVAQCVDFRRVGAWIDGDFITEVSNMPPVVAGDQVDEAEVLKFQDEKPVVKGALLGKFLSESSIDLIDAPPGMSITRDGDATASKINFVIKSTRPVPPNTRISFLVSNGEGNERYTKEIRYMPSPPTLTKIESATGQQGSALTYTLTGTNFTPGRTRVVISGAGVEVLEPADVLGTSLKVRLIISDSAAPGSRDLSVVNDNSQSAPKTFTITPKPSNP